MTNNPGLIPYLVELMQHAKTLRYTNRYGAQVAVRIQPLAMLDKANADPANITKLREAGVQDALVIGADETGIPILIACKTLKTYLLDPASSAPGSYLKNAITITH